MAGKEFMKECKFPKKPFMEEWIEAKRKQLEQAFHDAGCTPETCHEFKVLENPVGRSVLVGPNGDTGVSWDNTFIKFGGFTETG